jgi:tetratricopeptide (TPR) repeat protein
VRILVLGPVDLTTSDGTSVPLGGLAQKALLVALLQQAGKPVPADRATELIRNDSAAASVQTYISTLRRAIAAAGGGDALAVDESGFQLDVPASCTDVGVFTERLEQAKQAEQDNDLQRAAELYDAALGLWRGPALAGVDADFARMWAATLTQHRAEAQAGQARVQSAMHSEIMAHVQAPVGAQPRNLPPDVEDFTGRDQDLKTILRLGEAAGQRTVVVSGFGGVGKSALAVHAAYLMSSQFPDGQLFADLRGAEHAHEVLGRLLQAMGMPAGAVPASTEERAEQYQTRIAGRRFVIVLDNARSERQVRPLLPAGPGSLVMITSRSRLTGLAAEAIELNFLTLDDGVSLLGKILGSGRVAGQRADAERIVELCGGLPLAVRAAGAKLLAQPEWPLNALIVRLADERRRLDELTVGDLAIRSSLGLNYAELDGPQRRAFHLLCLLDLPDFGWWPVVPLLGVSPRAAEDIVEYLVDLRLVDVAGVDAIGRVRYRLHGLVQLFGAEQHESGVGVAAAVSRTLATWTALVEECARDLPQVTVSLLPAQTAQLSDVEVDPLLTDDAVHDPAEWLKSETASVTQMIERAHELGVDHGAIVALAARLAAPFAARNEFGEWQRVLQAARSAARTSGDTAAEAVMLAGLGQAHAEMDAFTEALAYFQQASTMAGDDRTRAVALVGTGSVHRELAAYDAAVADLKAAASSEYPAVVAAANYGLAAISRDHGDISTATARFQSCADTYRAIGDLRGAALALRGLSLCHRAVDDYAAAAELAAQAAAMLDEIGDELGTAYARQSWAKASLRLGRHSEAIAVLGTCLYTCTRRHDRFGVALMTRTLGEVHLATGDFVAAKETLGAALDLWTELDLPLWQARTLRDLAAAAVTGTPATAASHWARAQELSEASHGRENSELSALSPATWLAKVRV